MDIQFYKDAKKFESVPNSYKALIETLESLYPQNFLKFCNIFWISQQKQKVLIKNVDDFKQMLGQFDLKTTQEGHLIELTVKEENLKYTQLLQQAVEEGVMPQELLDLKLVSNFQTPQFKSEQKSFEMSTVVILENNEEEKQSYDSDEKVSEISVYIDSDATEKNDKLIQSGSQEDQEEKSCSFSILSDIEVSENEQDNQVIEKELMTEFGEEKEDSLKQVSQDGSEELQIDPQEIENKNQQTSLKEFTHELNSDIDQNAFNGNPNIQIHQSSYTLLESPSPHSKIQMQEQNAKFKSAGQKNEDQDKEYNNSNISKNLNYENINSNTKPSKINPAQQINQPEQITEPQKELKWQHQNSFLSNNTNSEVENLSVLEGCNFFSDQSNPNISDQENKNQGEKNVDLNLQKEQVEVNNKNSNAKITSISKITNSLRDTDTELQQPLILSKYDFMYCTNEYPQCQSCLKVLKRVLFYKCVSCVDYAICQNCEQMVYHKHPLLKIKTDGQSLCKTLYLGIEDLQLNMIRKDLSKLHPLNVKLTELFEKTKLEAQRIIKDIYSDALQKEPEHSKSSQAFNIESSIDVNYEEKRLFTESQLKRQGKQCLGNTQFKLDL